MVESGINHHKPNQTNDSYDIYRYKIWLKVALNTINQTKQMTAMIYIDIKYG